MILGSEHVTGTGTSAFRPLSVIQRGPSAPVPESAVRYRPCRRVITGLEGVIPHRDTLGRVPTAGHCADFKFHPSPAAASHWPTRRVTLAVTAPSRGVAAGNDS